MLPTLKLGKEESEVVKGYALEKLETLGVKDSAYKKASKLSGGQKQRVSIARSLINNPKIIMGDEPTGNLDSKNSKIVFDVLRKLSNEMDMSMIIVTHDNDFANKTDRIIKMEDGLIL